MFLHFYKEISRSGMLAIELIFFITKTEIMKNQLPVIVLSLLLCCTAIKSFAQIDSLVIYYDSCAVNNIQSNQPNTVFPYSSDFAALTWMEDSSAYTVRSLMPINLWQLPANAHILDARLSLFADTSSLLGFHNHPTYGSNNRGTLKRITGYWNANVTWNTQPQTTKVHEVHLHSSVNDVQHYLYLNITNMLQDMVDNPGPSNGIMIDLSDEQHFYKSLIFGSCMNPDYYLHPLITIVYHIEDTLKEVATEAVVGGAVTVSPTIASSTLLFQFHDFSNGDLVAISVFNLSGQVVSRENIVPQAYHSMDISDLASGMYFFKVENSSTKQVSAGKFIKN